MDYDELPANLQKVIEKGESITVEFKEAKKNYHLAYLKVCVQC